MRTTQSLVTAFAILLASAGSIRAEEPQLLEGSRLLWNGDTESYLPKFVQRLFI